ncbi:MAG: hypothetical protein KF883_06315 [Thermomicrobiales bacterium]|nr:hypothetical protein [Thermomicrobiales bacterium]
MSGRLDDSNRGRVVAWCLLGLPLAIYAIFWPVRARLDRAVIERHMAGSIWKRMAESLPGIGPQIILEALFWAGCVAFVAGALWLVWLALADAGEANANRSDPLDHAESDLPS